MKTSIDWLRYRTQSGPFDILEAMRPMFGTAHDLVSLKTGGSGVLGWKRSAELVLADEVHLGRIDYDGESQRGWVRVDLSGEGCEWVQDWGAAEALEGELKEATIKRIDVALTTYKGEITDAMVAAAHAAGAFTNGGRPPRMKSIVSSDPRAGRTRYIGAREAHKFLRCYEKGFELLTMVPESIRAGVTHIEGNLVDQIYRVELELKDVDKYIPWSAIGRRDEVFAGAYPFCAELLPGVPHWVMQTMPDFKPVATLEASLDNCRRAYGAILRAAAMAHGGDELLVLRRVMSETPSRALIDAGVLTCDHP